MTVSAGYQAQAPNQDDDVERESLTKSSVSTSAAQKAPLASYPNETDTQA